MNAVKQRIIDRFREVFPHTPAPRVFRAPGRVNLIGEHTDYNLGFVCPVALDLACFAASAPNSDGMFRVYSENRDELREWPSGDLPKCRPAGDWTDYVLGIALEVHRLRMGPEPVSLYISSTVPAGSGLSSSAALDVSVALALLGRDSIPPLRLALLARRAENEFVGIPCGIMDQYVSVFGHAHAAVKLDCRSLSHVAVPLPESVEILAVNTMVKHELSQSAYCERVSECAAAVEAIRRAHAEVRSLRDADMQMVNELHAVAPAVVQRARHVVSENQRVEEFVEACAANDVQKMGTLFVDSHRSLQRDYEVSCPELDFLVDTALSLAGVWGARMTGGGFGGCTVNLVDPRQAADFGRRITEAYLHRYGIAPEIYDCRPSAGASEI